MTDSNARMRSIFRLHCLNRLAKLQAKLEQPDWDMKIDREIELLVQLQTGLTLVLHDLGIVCTIGEDWEITDQLDQKS